MNNSEAPLAQFSHDAYNSNAPVSLDPQDIKPYSSNAKEYETGRNG